MASSGNPVSGTAHVVLVNPPAIRGRTNERSLSGGIGVSRRLKPFEREQPEVPAIDILYLAAVAEAAGARVTLVDLLLERCQGEAALTFCRERVTAAAQQVTWIGVRLSMPSLLEDLAFADRLKARLPQSRVFVFGNVIQSTVDHWVGRTSVDFVLYGEPEAFFAQVLAAPEPREVAGMLEPSTYRPLEGGDLYDEERVNARRARWVKVKDLNALPRPAWHLLELDRYAPPGAKRSELGVFVQASRGCPIGCTMCPYALLEGTTWRSIDVQRVVDEIAYLNRSFGIHRVRFRDPNFGFNRRYARALAEALIASKVELSASIESSVEVFDEETLKLLREAGVNTITTGVETNDAACMESIGQRLRVNDALRTRLAACHAFGYHVYGTYCLGTPEETWDTVEKTWRFAVELDIESGFTVMTPFPGTAMYFRLLREGLLQKTMQFSNWNSYRATARTYALTTTDLDMARWWARMETILPYRRKRAEAEGPLALAAFYSAHLPHYVWRRACRTYVGLRRRRAAEPADPKSPRSSPAPSAVEPRHGSRPALSLQSLREALQKLDENGAYRLLLHPEVLLSRVLHQREARERPLVMKNPPNSVEIELTNRCNLACIQCLRSQGLKPYTLGDMRFEDYRRILAQFPHALSVGLNGFGEPLLHAQFCEIVAHTRATLPWAKIVIYSNGMLLADGLAQRVLESGLTEVNISIDAAHSETYRKVRRGGKLEVVHQNIRDLLRRRSAAKLKLPLVNVNFVLLNENEGELVPFVEQAAELGVDCVNCISYATYDWGFQNLRSRESYRREIEQARVRLDDLKLECRSFPSDDLAWTDPQRPFDCGFFWGDSLRITYDGYVTLGCCTPFKETYSYGNLLETPFADIWNGPAFRRNRELVLRHEAPDPTCSSCHEQGSLFFAPRDSALLQLRRRRH
jgi:magnesium-protoporphyrin IX monomethyl ester (oxidative) cyclase